MPNRTSAFEWLRIAYHNLSAARVLFEAHHFTDCIGEDLQQGMEKSFKAVLAYRNERIPRTHDLLELYERIADIFEVSEEDIPLLVRATEYYKEDRYPNACYHLPERGEIAEIVVFAESLFEGICRVLQIQKEEIVNGEGG